MNKVITASILIVAVGIMSYFLYMYNYNEAKDAMSLVMPEFMLAYAELTTGDIAQFTPEQRYTYDSIGAEINFHMDTKNNSPTGKYKIR